MKLYKYSLILILGFSTLVSCSDKMDLLIPTSKPQVLSALMPMIWRKA